VTKPSLDLPYGNAFFVMPGCSGLAPAMAVEVLPVLQAGRLGDVLASTEKMGFDATYPVRKEQVSEVLSSCSAPSSGP
jgi:hypothetical protein